jgi:hypothetical protein
MFPEQIPPQRNINYDGSRFTADMAIQNVIGDSLVLLGFHPQWRRSRMGEVINGGLVWFLMDLKKHQDASIHAFLGCQQRISREAGLVTKELYLQ